MEERRKSFHRWSLQDVPYEAIETAKVREDATLFYLLVSSSFVESTTPLYAQNLVAFCGGDPEIAGWVERHWQGEEQRHGEALRRYVNAAWPEFDWEAAYRAFRAEYEPVCTVDEFQATVGLEMVSRCVVEVGTSTLYAMIADYTDEPVLRKLAGFIRTDEVHHYRFFHAAFLRHKAPEGLGRYRILRATLNRLNIIDDEDTEIPLKHVADGLPAGHPFRDVDYRSIRKRYALASYSHYPYRMAALMLLRPLALGPALRKPLVPLLVTAVRWASKHYGQPGMSVNG